MRGGSFAQNRPWPCLAVPGLPWPPLAVPGRAWPCLASPGLLLAGQTGPIPDPPGSLASLASLDNPASQHGWPDEQGSGIRHGSGIWDPGIEILGSEIRVWESGSGIWDPGSGIRKSYLWVGGMRRSLLNFLCIS